MSDDIFDYDDRHEALNKTSTDVAKAQGTASVAKIRAERNDLPQAEDLENVLNRLEKVRQELCDEIEEEIERSRMQEHLAGLDLEEVQAYVERTLSDDQIYEFGGPEAFLDAVEKAEKRGKNRDDVLKFIQEKREGESQQ